jgi:hypothetical protein
MRKRALRSNSIIVVLWIMGTMFLRAETRIIHADITGDGVNDDIMVGNDYVMVTDKMLCCIKKRHIIVRDVVDLVDLQVDEYCRALPGKEIAVVMRDQKGLYTEVYGMKDNRVFRASDSLPGQIARDEKGFVYGYVTHLKDEQEIPVPYFIEEHEGILFAADVRIVCDTVLLATSEESRFLCEAPAQGIMFISAISLNNDANILITNRNRDCMHEGMIRSNTVFCVAIVAQRSDILETHLHATCDPAEIVYRCAYAVPTQ